MKDPVISDVREQYRAKNESMGQGLKVADEVWIATALLHQENPDRDDFSVKEIRARLLRENIAGEVRPGVQPHISRHCVANRPPDPARYRMLFATGTARRRLFRPGDPYDRKRAGAKTTPDIDDIPPKYRPLLDWYRQTYAKAAVPQRGDDPILGLRGLGAEIRDNEHPDEHVRRLREGWA